jgi:hypothetical protein
MLDILCIEKIGSRTQRGRVEGCTTGNVSSMRIMIIHMDGINNVLIVHLKNRINVLPTQKINHGMSPTPILWEVIFTGDEKFLVKKGRNPWCGIRKLGGKRNGRTQDQHQNQNHRNIGKFLQMASVGQAKAILFAPVNSVVLVLVGVLGNRVHIVRGVRPAEVCGGHM